MHEQERDCRRGHAGNARGLADRLRPVLVQLLLHLHGQTADRPIIQISGQAPRLLPRPPADLVVLPIDVAGVFGGDLDLLVRYQASDISNTTQTFQTNISLIKALVAKYPEFRDAFAGVVARAVDPSGQDFGTMLPMKDIK